MIVSSGVSLRLHSNLFYQKFLMMANRTRGARGGLKLSRTLHESPATASLHSATPKKNVPCSFDFRGGGFFLEWKGHFFLFGVLPSSIQVEWRGFNADSV